jgi:malonyl-CoA O-methyltransferase
VTESIDRNKVKASFHRQAGAYDQYATVQKRVVARLMAELSCREVRPARVLDIGSGTGRLLAEVSAEYPEAMLVGADLALGMCCTARDNLAGCEQIDLVTADAEQLPFAADAFDLVLSTSTFQWLTGLEQAFREAWRVLAPGGTFCFALFGEQTLFELKSSYRRALRGMSSTPEDRTHQFFSGERVADILAQCGFEHTRVTSELEMDLHRDVPALLRSLKQIGAGNAASSHAAGLSGRRVMLDMMAGYSREFGRPDGIPATYEVLYGVGRKKGGTDEDNQLTPAGSSVY